MSKMRWLGIDFYFAVFLKVAIMKSLSCSPHPTPIPKFTNPDFSQYVQKSDYF